MPIRKHIAPLMLLTASVVAGCGEATLDTGNVETLIRQQFPRQLGTDLKSVTCPKHVTAKKGGMFDCKATGADGSTALVRVRQTDDSGRIRVDIQPLLKQRRG